MLEAGCHRLGEVFGVVLVELPNQQSVGDKGVRQFHRAMLDLRRRSDLRNDRTVAASGEIGESNVLVRVSQRRGKWVLAATILGSGMALLDGTVVNVALPRIGTDFNASLSQLQWVVNGYLLTLSAFILLGGSLGDRYGRKRIFIIGVTWFTIASVVCGMAPSINLLILARILQGIGAALLTPGSLAIIQASFEPTDRGRAIGAWSALGSIAAAIGPLVGGWLVQAASWRLVFFINVPLGLLVLWIGLKHVPESHGRLTRRLDIPGTVLGVVGLAGVTYALIEWPVRGGGDALVLGSLVIGLGSLVAFVLVEDRREDAMMPPALFGSRQFSAANAETFVVYGALGVITLFLVLELQVVSGYSPLLSGFALVPLTFCLLLLSSESGALSQRIGPRLQMTVGPFIAAAGVLLLVRVGPHANYFTEVLPGVLLFGLGLATLVAPLTTTVLGAAPVDQAGIASGVNNAVARASGLLTVAVMPLLVGLRGEQYKEPAALHSAYQHIMVICAGMLVAGGLLGGLFIRNPRRDAVRELSPDDQS